MDGLDTDQFKHRRLAMDTDQYVAGSPLILANMEADLIRHMIFIPETQVILTL